MSDTPFSHALLAGGGAGLSVDMVLFPLDTVKTRLQSAQGFYQAGGFRGIYAGVGSAAAGSVPGASLFFVSYETMKHVLHPAAETRPSLMPAVHMTAAACGEVMACLVRVPTEVVKQRAQAAPHISTLTVFRNTLAHEGFGGFYRGYFSTVLREIPFSLIQFPLWEYLKSQWGHQQDKPVEPWQSAVAGAVSGAVAAGLTTPLDVAKTRIMLAKPGTTEAKGRIIPTLRIVYREKGVPGLCAGMTPRIMWISLGGAIFLGVYDKIRHWLQTQTSYR